MRSWRDWSWADGNFWDSGVQPHTAIAPNQVWSWDCTWLPGPAKGTYYYLVMILDIFSRKVVGWEAFLGESAANSRRVIERAVLAENMVGQPLVLHADNGSPFKGVTLLEKLRDLQIQPSFSRPRVSNDNAFSEALFRTCKYVPNYPVSGFADLSAAQRWVHGFVQWYNYEHRHSAIRFVTPMQRHTGEDKAILAKRPPKRTYYLRQPEGRRLFDLKLSGAGLALCGASSPQDQTLIERVLAALDPADPRPDRFAREFLKAKGVHHVDNVFDSFDPAVAHRLAAE